MLTPPYLKRSPFSLADLLVSMLLCLCSFRGGVLVPAEDCVMGFLYCNLRILQGA